MIRRLDRSLISAMPARSPRGRRSTRAGAAAIRVVLAAGLTAAAGVARAAGIAGQPGQGGFVPNAGLPKRSGSFAVDGLAAPVSIELDRFDVPRIEAASIEDAAAGLGFMHAQERFFQMDATRRYAAGTLAELIGPAGVAEDRRMRRYDFAGVADAAYERLPARHRRLLEAYAAGVNAGVAALDPAPLEHAALGAAPEPWRPADALLAMLALADALHYEAGTEARIGRVRDPVPPALFDFLSVARGPAEAPMIPGPLDEVPLAVPGPEVLDLRAHALPRDPGAACAHAGAARDAPPGTATSSAEWTPFGPSDPATGRPLALGSNAWAVSGAHTVDGRAILAGDPHLMLTAPGIWYRAELRWGAGDDASAGRRLLGVSLPGMPLVAIGTNTKVAWTFTNTTADFEDLVVVEVDPDDPARYRVPGGTEPFGVRTETIRVRGGEPVELEVRTTRWGPVWDRDHRGRPLALRWTALDPEHLDLQALDLATADTLEQAWATVAAWRGPSQTAVLADASGRVGWVVSGFLPNRRGFDGRSPVSWADGDAGWDGALPEAWRPGALDPASGLVWCANNRTVGPRWAARLGHGWDDGFRAGRVRAMLEAAVAGGAEADAPLDEERFRRMQLDVRVEALDPWARDLARIAERRPGDPVIVRAGALAAAWSGYASADEPAMSLLLAFRRAGERAVAERLLAPFVPDGADRAAVAGRARSQAIRAVLEQRPAHLEPAPAGGDEETGWDAVLDSALDEALARLGARDDPDLVGAPWGPRNAARIAHPLAEVRPELRGVLSMPDHPQPGHVLAVRVSAPSFGASCRFVVSPGREDRGILQMPAGQSGHPFAPGFRSLHPSWREGAAQPLATGPPVATLRLRPPR